jgi:chromosome segregation ATPase
LLKQHDEAIVNVARLKAERDPLDKVFKQRQAEYEKSMIKHAEFPSVPEVQNLHRVKYAERVRFLDAEIQKAQDAADATTRSIAQAISSLSEPKTKVTVATPTFSSQQQETSTKQQAEIAELKTKLRKFEAEYSQERDNLKAEFEKHHAELKEQIKEQMREQMKEMAKGMKEIKEIKSMKRANEESVEGVKEQVRAVRAELDKQQSKSREAVSAAEVSALVRKESSVLQADITGLLKRVSELTEQLAQRAQDTATLRKDLMVCTQRVDDEARKIGEHEEKLSSLDTEALDSAAEAVSIGFPDLQAKVASLQTRMDHTISLREVDARQETLFSQVQQYVQGMGEDLGQLVDEAQKATTEHEARIKALEAASTCAPSPDPDTGHRQSAKAEFDTISSDIASIKSEFDATKVAINRLTKDVSKIASEDLNKQVEMLRQSFLVLDSQFNNLSTKSLAEHIIGHLEHFYPSARQLNADIEFLKSVVGTLGSRIDELEGRLEDFKGKASSFSEAKPFDTSEVASMQSLLLQNLDESGRPTLKRRRIDSSHNGVEHLVPLTNGTG